MHRTKVVKVLDYRQQMFKMASLVEAMLKGNLVDGYAKPSAHIELGVEIEWRFKEITPYHSALEKRLLAEIDYIWQEMTSPPFKALKK